MAVLGEIGWTPQNVLQKLNPKQKKVLEKVPLSFIAQQSQTFTNANENVNGLFYIPGMTNTPISVSKINKDLLGETL